MAKRADGKGPPWSVWGKVRPHLQSLQCLAITRILGRDNRNVPTACTPIAAVRTGRSVAFLQAPSDAVRLPQTLWPSPIRRVLRRKEMNFGTASVHNRSDAALWKVKRPLSVI